MVSWAIIIIIICTKNHLSEINGAITHAICVTSRKQIYFWVKKGDQWKEKHNWLNEWEIFFCLSLYCVYSTKYICQQSADCFFHVFFFFCLFYSMVFLTLNRQFICSQNVFYVLYTLSKQFEWILMDEAWKWAYQRKKKEKNIEFLYFRTIDFEKCLVITIKIQWILFGLSTCAMWCDVLICWFQNWNF